MGSRVGARWAGVGTARKYPTKSTYTPSQQIVARRIVPSSWYPPVRAVPSSRQAGTLQCGRSPGQSVSSPSPSVSAQGPSVRSALGPSKVSTRSRYSLVCFCRVYVPSLARASPQRLHNTRCSLHRASMSAGWQIDDDADAIWLHGRHENVEPPRLMAGYLWRS